MVTRIAGFHYGHDTAAAVLEDGIPVFHAELERFSRKKYDMGDALGLLFENPGYDKIHEVKYFCHENYNNLLNEMRESPHHSKMNQVIKNNDGKFFKVGHHQSHAANAFFSSNFDEALIVVIDGGGDGCVSRDDGETFYKAGDLNFFGEEMSYVPTPGQRNGSSLNIWHGSGNKVHPIETYDYNKHNVGKMWYHATTKLAKLSFGSEGTLMAMAAMGNKKRFANRILADLNNKNALKLHRKLHAYIKDKYGREIRNEKDLFDFAAGLQQATEMYIKAIVEQHIKKHNYKNICLAGGVALNSVMTSKFYDWFDVDNVYVCPIPYDSGLAIGTAQLVWHQFMDNPRVTWDTKPTPYLGKQYDTSEIKKAIEQSRHRDRITTKQVTDQQVIELLAQQKLVSAFHGGSESGRRALGNRSILADPRSDKMKGLINEKVKHRQWFRPFAPSVLREHVNEWFDKDIDSPYMSFVLGIKKDKRSQVPAVNHFNGSARLQTVTEKDNFWYYNFIKLWYNKTGVPMLLNTSFNDREPIVETPTNAIDCFMKTDLDYLYFPKEGILVSKK